MRLENMFNKYGTVIHESKTRVKSGAEVGRPFSATGVKI